MTPYASSIIDFYFSSKDTGFATGKSSLPLNSAVILYTHEWGADLDAKISEWNSAGVLLEDPARDQSDLLCVNRRFAAHSSQNSKIN